jgi:glycosyltransferase involved in cell wall biosynthesis
MSTTKIFIDPTSRILYSSFYIKGLYEEFGRKNVSFKRKYFKDLNRKEEAYSYNHYFAFVMVKQNTIKRFIVDFCDPPDISSIAYQWCDVYAKINYNKSFKIEDSTKIVIIPPGFGIKIWSLPTTIFYCLKNLITNIFSIPVTPILFLKDYWKQYKRIPIEYYLDLNLKEKDNYVFMIGTFWKPSDTAKITNQLRLQFIKSCLKNKNLLFEGGLFATENHPDYQKYKPYIFSTFYTLKSYVDKTKHSAFVFNTPAVHNCHGWKLAEFLALGKPILSTPLSNELPADLKHGEEIHIVACENDMETVIQNLIDNSEYRKKLGKNAAKYFKQYASPSQVIKSIII